ncbi:diguanylate cyclase [Pseudobacteroides cellulosolvens ATCC 35603 = DSM 2933]|uniref:Diguanylate cyclase n=2 Tax=Pseudobacteroides cellulosolvens TaxID=35825 RepID=A0A0L6JI80_9FIRM|nr:diguanylate cyclase [Pseudobacteroides cellulosolvens]KNY25425.1 diguanylate cyclase [Pseudobacteroides cellulosolvens ATCC 35603 = DSM 2933]
MFSVLAALSMIARIFELNFSYGISFAFGNVFTIIILSYYGKFKALSVAVVSNVLDICFFNGSIYTVFFTFEILVLSIFWKNKIRKLLFIDILYWIMVGIPFSFLIYYLNNRTFGLEVYLLVINNWICGNINVLIADLIISYVPIQLILGRKEKILTDLNRLMFHLTIAAVIGPFLVYIMIDGWLTQDRVSSEISQILNTSRLNIIDQINSWDTNDLRKIRLRSPVHLKDLKEIIASNPLNDKVEVFVVDRKNSLYSANRNLEKPNMIYDWKDGGNIINVSDNIYCWMPESKRLGFDIKKWSKAFYIMVYQFEDIDLQLQIKVPLSNYTVSIWENYRNKFHILIVFCFISIFISIMMGRVLSRDLSKLTQSTTDLPDKLKRQEIIEWPDTSMVQVNNLVSNFKVMSNNLVTLFNDINIMNDKLLSQTIELENSREEMKRLAYNDALTGLPNRYYFTNYLEELLSSGYERKIAVMFIDLNRFKHINDKLGHDIGDMLLKEVANRFKYVLGHDDFVARLGGDEFVIILRDIDYEKASVTAEQINNVLCETVIVLQKDKKYELNISGSIGISLYPDDAVDKTTLLKMADMAMYASKETGEKEFKFYSDLNKIVLS